MSDMQKDLVLSINEYAYVLDETKGDVVMNKKMLNTINAGLSCLLGGLYLGKGVITKNNWDLGLGLSWLAIGVTEVALSVKSLKEKHNKGEI